MKNKIIIYSHKKRAKYNLTEKVMLSNKLKKYYIIATTSFLQKYYKKIKINLIFF